MKIYQKILSIFVVLFLMFSFFGKPVLLEAAGSGEAGAPTPVEASAESGGSSFPNPLKLADSPQYLIGKIIDFILGIVGSIALLTFIYGGFKMMIARGNPKEVQEGMDAIKWSAVGLIVIFFSYAMVTFIFDAMIPKS